MSSHHTPRKTFSNLSLKQRTARLASARPSYFDIYPRPNSSPSDPPHLLPNTSSSSRSEKESYAFPSIDSDQESPPAVDPPNLSFSRTRSRTNPSSKSRWSGATSVPPLSYSGSSSTQHTETPPDTPVDPAENDSFDTFSVLVAAPIAGVETMDALVDGMNGRSRSRDLSILNRTQFCIPGHHPLYQPPLPTPPPGIVLGGGKGRRSKKKSVSSPPSSDSDGEGHASATSSRPRRKVHKTSSRVPSTSTLRSMPASGSSKTLTLNLAEDGLSQPRDIHHERTKTVVPSISEIIRIHAPHQVKDRSGSPTVGAPSIYSNNFGHTTVNDDNDYEPQRFDCDQDADLVSRSSIDSVADEVQKTLRKQLSMKPPPAPPSSFPKRNSYFSDNASLFSRSDYNGAPSIYSLPVGSSYGPPSPSEAYFTSPTTDSKSSVAQYLRSARLTTLLKLTRSPHASQDNPLTISLSDLGSQTGFPVVVFLGLGCVRHIMGLYDEMAEFLGLRLITIDRWGLGRTEPRSKSAKGIIQWASVVEEVLDLLRIGQCSIMAHSAGAPYALSFANKLPARIRGDICLLAPWVGGSENSKFFKLSPSRLLTFSKVDTNGSSTFLMAF